MAADISEDQPIDLAPGEEEALAGAEEEDLAALFGDAADEGGVVEVSPADFDELIEAAPGDGKGRKINLLLDVELDVSVELGRKIMIVDEILRLGKGSVIELNKLAGEPVDVLVNGKKLAEGEVVVVEDHFGVRLTHLLDPKERIKSLGR
ncbi:MAG: flagellar motor switch protein FliN [Fidelibacterota bacterium]|nr:MAG: flagellar motor switch protein FliN [Candidatus Neomarinimicrobiota bacterium]